MTGAFKGGIPEDQLKHLEQKIRAQVMAGLFRNTDPLVEAIMENLEIGLRHGKSGVFWEGYLPTPVFIIVPGKVKEQIGFSVDVRVEKDVGFFRRLRNQFVEIKTYLKKK